jgi:hypothetical protein
MLPVNPEDDFADARISAYYRALGRTELENKFLEKLCDRLRDNTNLFTGTTSLLDIGCGSGNKSPKYAGERGVWITDLVQQYNPNAVYYGVDLYPEHAIGAQQKFRSRPSIDAPNIIAAADGFTSDYKTLFQYDEPPNILFASHVVYDSGKSFETFIKRIHEGMGPRSLALFVHMGVESDTKELKHHLGLSEKKSTRNGLKFGAGGKDPIDIERECRKNNMGLSSVSLPVTLKFPRLDDDAIDHIIAHPEYTLPPNGQLPSDEVQFRLLLEHVLKTPLTELSSDSSVMSNRREIIRTLVDKWLKPNNFELKTPVTVQVVTKGASTDRVFKRGVERSVTEAATALGLVEPARSVGR